MKTVAGGMAPQVANKQAMGKTTQAVVIPGIGRAEEKNMEERTRAKIALMLLGGGSAPPRRHGWVVGIGDNKIFPANEAPRVGQEEGTTSGKEMEKMMETIRKTKTARVVMRMHGTVRDRMTGIECRNVGGTFPWYDHGQSR